MKTRHLFSICIAFALLLDIGLALILASHAADSAAAAEASTPPNRDFYTILNVPRTATPAELKKAYRKAAIRFFPDRPKETDQRKFKDILEAYEILSNPITRNIYDRDGEEGIRKFRQDVEPSFDFSQFFGKKNEELSAKKNEEL